MKTKIYSIIGIDDFTLLVYRSEDRLYRFSIIDGYGCAFNFDGVVTTEEEASVKGRIAIEIALDFDRNFSR